ncbi:MAG: 50S ribosomal protein L24 [Nitrosarchaeum sp.]|nr:50S ribosomal protein L24 [Nitrosarchaeum sp.]MCA9820117.1 50S ribosomal protein L24 [Nitrosarchaeum sp.]
MKPSKMRNSQMHRALFNVSSKQLSSQLSKDLQKKYSSKRVRVIKGDTVKIVRGEFKGVDGKISRIYNEKNSVAVEGIKKEKTKGDKFDVYIHTSNLLVTDLNTEDKLRVTKIEGKTQNSKSTNKESKKEESE